jgi:acyl-CoA synthetase (AMP-forming)/AMP-acid ligase II
MIDFKKILKEGCTISSSGTTGLPKNIYRSPDNLKECNSVAIESQKITANSKIYTCTRMTHAGGLLLQSLPAYTLGCDITIEKFNAYSFLKRFKGHTHTFLAPAMCEAVINTKGFAKSNLKGKTISMGSDVIPWDHISRFVEKGATVIANWGMSEIGPCAINTVFSDLEYVDAHIAWAPNNLPILGENMHCLYKIEDGQLHVKGDICIHDGWFATGDLVKEKHKIPPHRYFPILYYAGRVYNDV